MSSPKEAFDMTGDAHSAPFSFRQPDSRRSSETESSVGYSLQTPPTISEFAQAGRRAELDLNLELTTPPESPSVGSPRSFRRQAFGQNSTQNPEAASTPTRDPGRSPATSSLSPHSPLKAGESFSMLSRRNSSNATGSSEKEAETSEPSDEAKQKAFMQAKANALGRNRERATAVTRRHGNASSKLRRMVGTTDPPLLNRTQSNGDLSRPRSALERVSSCDNLRRVNTARPNTSCGMRSGATSPPSEEDVSPAPERIKRAVSFACPEPPPSEWSIDAEERPEGRPRARTATKPVVVKKPSTPTSPTSPTLKKNIKVAGPVGIAVEPDSSEKAGPEIVPIRPPLTPTGGPTSPRGSGVHLSQNLLSPTPHRLSSLSNLAEEALDDVCDVLSDGSFDPSSDESERSISPSPRRHSASGRHSPHDLRRRRGSRSPCLRSLGSGSPKPSSSSDLVSFVMEVPELDLEDHTNSPTSGHKRKSTPLRLAPLTGSSGNLSATPPEGSPSFSSPRSSLSPTQKDPLSRFNSRRQSTEGELSPPPIGCPNPTRLQPVKRKSRGDLKGRKSPKSPGNSPTPSPTPPCSDVPREKKSPARRLVKTKAEALDREIKPLSSPEAAPEAEKGMGFTLSNSAKSDIEKGIPPVNASFGGIGF